MNRLLRKRMLIISISLAFLLLINIGVSYSYYLGKVVGNESSTTLSLTSAGIIINYENNSGVITDNNITPGWSSTKKFSVSSTFNQESTNLSKLWYVVKICVDDNDFLSDKIVYSLTTDGEIIGNGKALDNVENKGIATGTNAEGIVIGSGYFVSGSNQHNYNITFKYIDSEVISSGSKFNVHIVVEASLEARVNINLDGGNISGSTQISSAKYKTITLEEPIKNGYYFEGWEITSGNGTINGNELYINDTNISIKANYREQSFATDTWEEIAFNVRSGNTKKYKVGETREVAIDGYTNTDEKPTFTVRLVNNSNYDCTLASKTACGLVVDFVDIITKYTTMATRTNKGGWPATMVRPFLNNVLINFFPDELKDFIIDTDVVSGHGTSDSSNFYTVDKLYLLSAPEVYANCDSYCYDTAQSATRQLDFYYGGFPMNGVTTTRILISSTSTTLPNAPLKKWGGNNSVWGLRTASYAGNTTWRYLSYPDTLRYMNYYPDSEQLVAPAFRIG